jgi:hypothetical protein
VKNNLNMKNIILILLSFLSINNLKAQVSTDANRIILNSIVLDKDNKIPEEAKTQLLSKLTQISTKSGMGGNSLTQRFVIAAKINIQTKDIIAGPPQMIAMNSEIVFFIGDIETNQVFASYSILAKGVGGNENKALISSIQNININSSPLLDFTQNGKNKIIQYFTEQCDYIIKRAQTKAEQQLFDESIYDLMQVPEVCQSCFMKCLSAVQPIYKKKIDRDGEMKLNQARSKWNANQNRQGADEVSAILSSIEPESASYKNALIFSETIRVKIQEIEKRNWEFKMKKYNDAISLENQRIDFIRQAAIAYYQNQPRTIIYNRIIW